MPTNNCSRCDLCYSSISNTGVSAVCVDGRGPLDSPIVFVGEALGSVEVEQALPFVGQAGQLLDQLIRDAELSDVSLRVTNVCRCRPPENRVPTPTEIEACRPFLAKELKLVKPKLIVCLGATAAQTVLRVRTLQEVRGRFFRSDEFNCTVLSTYHPAALLRQPKPASGEHPMRRLMVEDLKEAKYWLAHGIKRPVNLDFWAATSASAVRKLFEELESVDSFVLDLETTGFDRRNDKVLCGSFAWKPNQAAILPLRGQATVEHPLGEPFWSERMTRYILDRWHRLVSSGKRMSNHNCKFDGTFMVAGLGFLNLQPWFCDTMQGQHLLDENGPHDLEGLSGMYLGVSPWDEGIRNHLPNTKTPYSVIPPEELWRYACFDSHYTRRLEHEIILPRLQAEPKLLNLFNTLTMPMVNALTWMEVEGFGVDVYKLSVAIEENQRALATKVEKLFHLAGHDFKWKNSAVVAQVLFEEQGITPIKRTEKNKSWSTDAEVLDKLTGHPIVDALLDVRKTTKTIELLVGSETGEGKTGIRRYLDPNGNIHPVYSIHGTRNGRLSCTEPPLHNVPRDSEKYAIAVRNLFRASRPNWLLGEFDYDQAEFRVAAWHSQDPEVLKIFEENLDIHKFAAEAMFQVPYAKVDKEQRYLAKFINFGVLFGRGESSLDDQFHIGRDKAHAFMQNYWGRFSVLYGWMQEIKREARTKGVLELPSGRKRRFPGYRGDDPGKLADIERQALNFPCAGVVTDVMSMATVEIAEKGRKEDWVRFVLNHSLHDALYPSHHPDHIEESAHFIGTTMTKTRWGISLPVRGTVGKYWGDPEAKEYVFPAVTPLRKR